MNIKTIEFVKWCFIAFILGFFIAFVCWWLEFPIYIVGFIQALVTGGILIKSSSKWQV